MNIGFISTRLAGLDGVSLETSKIAHVFEALGHQCFYCAGELDESRSPGRLVPLMHFTHPDIKAIHDEAFRLPNASPQLVTEIYAIADTLRGEIHAFVQEYAIDILISQNSNAIPMNIPLGLAITDYAKRHPIKLICHNHDFYWERERFVINGIQSILDEAFPPRLPNAVHWTINTMMQRRLYSFRGIPSLYVPNVFNFDTAPPPPDDYTLSFRAEVGLAEDDIIVLQPTRLIRRKGIELAIDLLKKLDDKRLVYVLTGSDKDAVGGYGLWLKEQLDASGIRYLLIADYLDDQRGMFDGHKTFTLWDAYYHAHIITYPSTYEGFGNALIETVYFGKAFVVNTYPIYLSDIKPVGIQAVEFNLDITNDLLAQTRRLIEDADWRNEMVKINYQVAQTHFSYQVLHEKIQQTLDLLSHD